MSRRNGVKEKFKQVWRVEAAEAGKGRNGRTAIGKPGTACTDSRGDRRRMQRAAEKMAALPVGSDSALSYCDLGPRSRSHGSRPRRLRRLGPVRPGPLSRQRLSRPIALPHQRPRRPIALAAHQKTRNRKGGSASNMRFYGCCRVISAAPRAHAIPSASGHRVRRWPPRTPRRSAGPRRP